MNYLKIIVLLCATIISIDFTAQENLKLTILVKDAQNSPVPGAIILLDNVRQKRFTNSAGYFKIKLKNIPKEITAFSPILGIKKVNYNGNSNVIINLVKDSDKLALDNTNDKKVVDPILYRNIFDYLRGKVPGVNIDLNNQIRIRGASTFFGGRTPLLVLNGVIIGMESFSTIVPTTIKSIKVLKGPESSIYGVRGANGVIEVSTTI